MRVIVLLDIPDPEKDLEKAVPDAKGIYPLAIVQIGEDPDDEVLSYFADILQEIALERDLDSAVAQELLRKLSLKI